MEALGEVLAIMYLEVRSGGRRASAGLVAERGDYENGKIEALSGLHSRFN